MKGKIGVCLPFCRHTGVVWTLLISATLSFAQSQRPAAPTPTTPPRATITDVREFFLQDDNSTGAMNAIGGARVRAFDPAPVAEQGRMEYDIHWYAHPPGVPPGLLFLFEYTLQNGNRIFTKHLSLRHHIEGYQKLAFIIPAEELASGGRVKTWRMSILFRGKILDQRTSKYWEIER